MPFVVLKPPPPSDEESAAEDLAAAVARIADNKTCPKYLQRAYAAYLARS